MSGHSHWATIKRKKEAADQEKGKLFSKITREIMVAVSEGGGITDPENNIRLRGALEKAREVNMPKENIQRVLDRAREKKNALTEVIYEALGPSSVTFIIKTATDNPRRTHTELSIVLDKNGGKLVEKGAVAFMYDLCGLLTYQGDSEEALSLAESIGAVDLESEGKTYFLYVPYRDLSVAWSKARNRGVNKAPELIYKAKIYLDVDKETQSKALKLLEKLEAVEGVQEIYTNIKFTDN